MCIVRKIITLLLKFVIITIMTDINTLLTLRSKDWEVSLPFFLGDPSTTPSNLVYQNYLKDNIKICFGIYGRLINVYKDLSNFQRLINPTLLPPLVNPSTIEGPVTIFDRWPDVWYHHDCHTRGPSGRTSD